MIRGTWEALGRQIRGSLEPRPLQCLPPCLLKDMTKIGWPLEEVVRFPAIPYVSRTFLPASAANAGRRWLGRATKALPVLFGIHPRHQGLEAVHDFPMRKSPKIVQEDLLTYPSIWHTLHHTFAKKFKIRRYYVTRIFGYQLSVLGWYQRL